MEQQKPIHMITCGAIRAYVWRNECASRLFHDVTFPRRYRDLNGWATTCSFGVKDLPVLAKVILDAHVWIHARLASGEDATSPRAADVATDQAPAGPQ